MHHRHMHDDSNKQQYKERKVQLVPQREQSFISRELGDATYVVQVIANVFSNCPLKQLPDV